jgi:hypothetical protein
MLKPQRGQLRYGVLVLDVEPVVRWGAGESPTDPRGLRRLWGTSLQRRMARLLYACVPVLTIQVNTPTPAGYLEPVACSPRAEAKRDRSYSLAERPMTVVSAPSRFSDSGVCVIGTTPGLTSVATPARCGPRARAICRR